MIVCSCCLFVLNRIVTQARGEMEWWSEGKRCVHVCVMNENSMRSSFPYSIASDEESVHICRER